jgi:hypothetical protein
LRQAGKNFLLPANPRGPENLQVPFSDLTFP